MSQNLTNKMKEKQGIMKQLKKENQMFWVGMMNNIRSAAKEIVLRDMIYQERGGVI